MIDQNIEAEIQSEPGYEDLVGQRVILKQNVGSIRYAGKLINNPKAGNDIWLGIEWDEEGHGKHMGNVDGVQYFFCEFHKLSPNYEGQQTQCCSFIRYGKIQIGGTDIRQAIVEKYRPDDMMTEEEKEKLKQNENEEIYVNTDMKGRKKIEVLGQDQSYQWRSDVRQNYEIALECLKISDLGPRGTLNSLIPSTMYLYLDKNLLHSWDQYFQITRELRYLRILVLTGNKFKRIDKNYLADKKVEEMINPFLHELVLIDMALDWSQIDALAPTMIYIEELHLVRSQCNKICSEYQISKEHFKNLRFINLEQNGIESWDEIVGFRNLPGLRRITVSKNKIREIYYKPGFNDLYMVTMEDNLINSWRSFDALNEFKRITHLRCSGNPIYEQAGTLSRQQVTARLQFLKNLNGSAIEEGERKDAEIIYMKKSYEDYIRENKIEVKLELNDENLMKHMMENQPRWYELVEIYGNPIDMVSLKQDAKNIASTSAKIKLISQCTSTNGKTLEKKLITSMTVGALKAMCAKLFKIEVIRQSLIYKEESCEPYELDEDLRQLSFYSIRDGGEIAIIEKQ
ncbi:UNKNOWN [Stylonychia lemnae]|uniref:CAP-Gly domain-containing protein n=1 Tax=Stylonychia lemnae TaxID=5949 RepID=A0A077ZZD3_STYLE|nr:UNKNOWN [Stylonychia lemnae]CDW74586.1 UNKNOWN [Stylonychia lemnae]|eukprot:CDW74583.1 UNKNOWN [Stylonychia lemnae]